MSSTSTAYPASLAIDYPEGKRNRLTNFFRLFTAIPICIVLALLVGADTGWNGGASTGGYRSSLIGGGLVVLPTLFMILFRQKYPRWWFDWNLALIGFITRVDAYFSLLRDEYPSTDDQQAVHIEIPYPDAGAELNRWLPLVKWFLAIPHYIVLFFLGIAAGVITVIAWFAILFTGSYPKSMFNFVVGVFRWSIRVLAYAVLLTTDHYPPFSLN